MKISFVEPKAAFYNFYSWTIKQLPLLGPIYLGTILKKQGYDVTIHNENIKEINYSEFKDSDILAISIMTSTAPRGYEIANNFRLVNPKGRVIIGGVHATFLPEEAAQYADHVIVGEAEPVISDLIRYGGEKIVPGKMVENLDDLPFLDFSLIARPRKLIGLAPLTPVSTSRGCPYDCTFCTVSSMFGRKYRFRTTDSVIEELSRRRHRHIFFYDDNFAANRVRTKELLTEMIRRKLTPGWTAQVRADIAKDEDLVELMAKANCHQLCIGFESMDPEILKSYNKKQTPEDTLDCIKVLHKHGITVHGMFISEGYSDIYDKIGLDSFQLSVLTPLAGSKLYSTVKEAGQLILRQFPTDWKFFDGTHVVHLPDNLSPFDLQQQTTQSLKNFYSRANIAKMLLKGKFIDFYVRCVGHHLLRKWEAQNKDYPAKLKQIQIIPQSYGTHRLDQSTS